MSISSPSVPVYYYECSGGRFRQRFRGSGFMPAADLERHVEPVDGELRARRMRPEDVEAPPDGAGTVERRVWRTRRAEQHDRMCAALEEMPVDGIDAGQTLRQQKFSKIPMSGGPSAEQVFSRLHEQRKGTP